MCDADSILRRRKNEFIRFSNDDCTFYQVVAFSSFALHKLKRAGNVFTDILGEMISERLSDSQKEKSAVFLIFYYGLHFIVLK